MTGQLERTELIEVVSEQPWIRVLLDCLVQNQKAARRFFGELKSAGFIPEGSSDTWRIILVAPPEWPRNS